MNKLRFKLKEKKKVDVGFCQIFTHISRRLHTKEMGVRERFCHLLQIMVLLLLSVTFLNSNIYDCPGGLLELPVLLKPKLGKK